MVMCQKPVQATLNSRTFVETQGISHSILTSLDKFLDHEPYLLDGSHVPPNFLPRRMNKSVNGM